MRQAKWSTGVLVASLLVVALGGCKKPPPFQAELEGFVAELAQGRAAQAQAYLTDDASLVNDMTGGEPQPGTVEHFPWANIGRYDWSKAVVEQVVVGEDGSQTVTFAAEVCMAAGDLANCTRPNVYTVVAKVAVVDGAWKISAASMSPRKVIR